MIVTEGKVKIKLDKDVFYNPKMTFCRHLDVLVWKCIEDKRDMLDALAGTGIRGIRAKVEAGYEVIFNDRNPKAFELIKENLRLNGITAEVYNRDACALMKERKFWHIDLDPFGSPAEFMDSACYSAKRYLSVTATDTAALCGSAVESGLRKYFVFAEMTEFYPEVGLRALIGFIARCLAVYEKGLRVLIAWAREHYYRVHVTVKKSLKSAKESVKKVGYLLYCPKCLNRAIIKVGECVERCDCGERFRIYGPLWLGELKDNNFVNEMIKRVEELENVDKNKVKKFLKSIAGEIDAPFGYSIHAISRILKVSPPKMDSILGKLKEMGYEASRVHYSGIVFKTDADIKVVKDVFLALNT